MSGASSVSVALETRLSLIANPISTQWENVVYTPVSGTPYQAVNLLFAKPLNEEKGTRYIENGYMQITLRYPIGKGKGEALTKAQSIREWFYRGLPLAADGVTVIIDLTPEIGVAQIDGDRYSLPVKVSFRAYNN